jgi:Lrp/AsnC family transcriptional regulator for asnA, asnC and gidA
MEHMKTANRLSETDRKIVACLQADPRSPISEISAQSGIPQTTVRNRLNRLLREGIVEIAAAVNPLQLGFDTWAMVALQVPAAEVQNLSASLTALDEVYFVSTTTGSYNMMVGVVLRSNADFAAFMTDTLGQFASIKGLYTFNVLRVFKRHFLFQVA